MAYCTQTDIERRIGSDDLAALADYDGDDTPDAAVVTQAIEDAQGDLDSYIGQVYEVPVAPVPDVLRKHCTNMAIYYLQLGRDSVTENFKKAYDDAVAWAKDVAAGKASLGTATAPDEASGAGGVRMSSETRRFGRGEPL